MFAFALLAFLSNTLPSYAATHYLVAEWQYIPPTENSLTGFKIFDTQGATVFETNDASARKAEFTLESEEGTNEFIISAVLDNGQLDSSDPIPFELVSTQVTAVLSASPATGDAPLNVLFDSSASTGTPDSYVWSFGDGTSSVATTPEHIYQDPGTYSVTLTLENVHGNTSEDSIEIVVTDSGISQTPTPPNVVISSSQAVGEAPLIVKFDGNDSSTPASAITNYSWDFGDGSTAIGATVENTYTQAGTYNAALTVTDSNGLSAQTSTPVIITSTFTPENQPPVPSYSASPSAGTAPFTVFFDASATSDPDGTITSYLWNFGDGLTATGLDVKHTFTKAATYTITLTATDNDGEKSSTNQTVTALQEDIKFNYEAGEIRIDHIWSRVEFSSTFKNPVVITSPLSFKDSQPALARIRNIDNKGFEIRIQEWNYQDDTHSFETVSFLVMEQGHFDLPNGTKVEAGQFQGDSTFSEHIFKKPFNQQPIILANPVTTNQSNPAANRLRNVSVNGFVHKLQGEEKSQDHVNETIHYIAWEQGTGSLDTTLYEIGNTDDKVNHNWLSLSFSQQSTTIPFYFAAMQSTDGGDTAGLRYTNLTNKSISIKIEEEQSKDSEINHTTETVGYLALFPSEQNQAEPGTTPLTINDDFSSDTINNYTSIKFQPYIDGGLARGQAWKESLMYHNTPLGNDHTVEALITHNSNTTDTGGLLFRIDPVLTTGYSAFFEKNTLRLYRFEGDSKTQIASAQNIAGTVTVRASITGNLIQIFIDNIEVINVTDSTYTSGEYVGMYFYRGWTNTDETIDNFKAQSHSLSESILDDTVDQTPLTINDDFSSDTVGNYTSIKFQPYIDGGLAHGQAWKESLIYHNTSLGNDHTVEAFITHNSNTTDTGGLLFRVNPVAETGYTIFFEKDTLRLYKFEKDSKTQIASAQNIAGTVTTRASITGSDIQIFVDDIEVISVTDSTYTSGEHVGMYFYRGWGNTDETVDNFKAQSHSLSESTQDDTVEQATIAITDDFSSNNITNYTSIENQTYIAEGKAHGQAWKVSKVYHNTPLGNDHTVEALITHNSNTTDTGGLLFRVNPDAETGYAIFFEKDTLRLYKFEKDSKTQIASTQNVAGTVTIRTSITGSDIQIFIDDAEVISVTDSTYTSGEHVGMYFYRGWANTDETVDNFKAQ